VGMIEWHEISFAPINLYNAPRINYNE